MNSPTQNQRNVMSGVVAAFERLIARRRAQSTNPAPVFKVAAGITTTPIHLHNGGLCDNGVLLLHDRSASDQNTLRREPRSGRDNGWTRRKGGAIDRCGRLCSRCAISTNERASRYEGGNLKPLIEAMPVAVIVVDDDHKVVLANEPAAALFGYTTNELRGLSFVQLCPRMADNSDSEVGSSGIFLPDSRFAAAGARRMAVARARDGSERPVSVQFKQYGTGAAPWIVTIVDPGEQSQTSAHELNRAQLARVFELAEMAAALAHEINQPLTAILGNAQAVQRFLRPEGFD